MKAHQEMFLQTSASVVFFSRRLNWNQLPPLITIQSLIALHMGFDDNKKNHPQYVVSLYLTFVIRKPVAWIFQQCFYWSEVTLRADLHPEEADQKWESPEVIRRSAGDRKWQGRGLGSVLKGLETRHFDGARLSCCAHTSVWVTTASTRLFFERRSSHFQKCRH